MGELIHINKGSTKESVAQALRGNERHRLCFDFNNIGGLKEFFVKAKQSGITHPDSIPVLLHKDDNKTVWLVGIKTLEGVIEALDV